MRQRARRIQDWSADSFVRSNRIWSQEQADMAFRAPISYPLCTCECAARRCQPGKGNWIGIKE